MIIFLKYLLFLVLFCSSLCGASLVLTEPIRDGALQNEGYFIGSLYFEESSHLASEVSGVVEELYVKEGDKVKKGQKLALLNSDLLNQDIASKEALLKRSKALLQKSTKDFQRYKNLYQNNSISFKEYEDALFALEAQEGSSQSIEAELAKLKKEKEKKSLLAPYDGIILSQAFKRGEWVSIGDSLFNIAKLTPLKASIDVPFNVLRTLKIGQKVEVMIASKSYNAFIAAVIPLGDSKARTFPIKLSIDDPQEELIAGLEVQVKLFVGGGYNGLLIPRDAILPDEDGSAIFIVRDSKATKIKVTVEKYSGNFAIIHPKEEGILNTNDKVIIKGHERLRDGVEIIETIAHN